jgi:hypothetical protein
MGYEVVAFLAQVLDMGVTERAFPDNSAITLGDDISIERGHHSLANHLVFVDYVANKYRLGESTADKTQ